MLRLQRGLPEGRRSLHGLPQTSFSTHCRYFQIAKYPNLRLRMRFVTAMRVSFLKSIAVFATARGITRAEPSSGCNCLSVEDRLLLLCEGIFWILLEMPLRTFDSRSEKLHAAVNACT
jgi:hypothetical protein